MTEDVGDGERCNIQSALVTDALNTQQREQDNNTDGCNEAVLEIRIADLIEYRSLALFPYRTVIDVVRVEMVQRLVVPRPVSLDLLPRLTVRGRCRHDNHNQDDCEAVHGLAPGGLRRLGCG